MKRVFLFVLMISTFCFPSFGQIREIYNDGEIIVHYGGGFFFSLGEAIFSYRVVYGRYPDKKRILLDYFLEVSKDEYDDYKADSTIISLLAERDSILTVDLNDPDNVLTVSGDTCIFSYAKPKREHTFYNVDDTVPIVRTLSSVQCIGGLTELQKTDYDMFRSWLRSRFYDKNGKCLWSLCTEAPYMPRNINRQFRYVVTMEPRIIHEDRHEIYPINWEEKTEPVLIAITITRSGILSYEMPRLDGIQLYYQELGKPFRLENALGTIEMEDVIDPDHLNAIKAYMKIFLDEHEEVETIKLWEAVLFN